MKKLFTYVLFGILIGISLSLLGAARTLADANMTNFESFTLGDVNGQGGWSSMGGFDEAVVSNTYGYSSFGTKSLRTSNAITSTSFNDQTFSASLVNEAGETTAETTSFSGGVRQPYYEAQWDIASTVPGAEQVGMSVVASADRGDSSRMTWLRIYDVPTGLELEFLSAYEDVVIATAIDRTIPHTIRTTLQFVEGSTNDIVNVYLDGVLIHTGTSWEDFYGTPQTVDSMLFREAGTAVPGNAGKGYLIDNFSEWSGSGAPATLHVIKHVTNDNNGTSDVSAFNLHVKQAGTDVAGSPDVGVVSPGRPYMLDAGTYAVSEDANIDYTATFSGDCDASGNITLAAGDNKTCTITNDDVAPIPAPSSGGRGGSRRTSPVVPPKFDIEVKASPSSLSVPGPVTYTYTLENTGDVTVTNITMSDNSCSSIDLISGDTDNDSRLDVGETWTYRCNAYLLATNTNTVTARGEANNTSMTKTASDTVVVGMLPSTIETGTTGIPNQNSGTAPSPGTVYDLGPSTILLRIGSSGAAVMELQKFLNAVLNSGLVVDGKLGPKTTVAIKIWQQANGLVADGIVGPKTKAKINLVTF